tara:strand:- start:239 stop:391 length:153 start_codon:yes stop_codon:yes gene_type:complete
MSRIEELVYSAYDHGKREPLLKEVSKIKTEYPHMNLNDIYEEAYKNIMNT